MNRNTQPHYSNRSSRQTSSQSVTVMSRPPSRPSSELLCDLHVYKVPPDLWRGPYNNILNDAVTETVSVGIIRVPAEIRLVDIREEIVLQLGANTDELVPKDYVFLRSVGRSLTTLRLKQEYQLKAKHFVPPVAYAPELYILEATPEIREALAASDTSSQSPPLSRQVSPRSYPNTYQPGHGDNERLNRPYPRTTSPGNKYKPLPHIGSDPYRERDTNRVPDGYPYNRNSPSPSVPSDDHHPSNGVHDTYRPNHYNSKNHKNSPQQKKRHPETDPEQPGSEWDEQPENKKANPDRTPLYIKSSPPQSAGKSRNRQDDDSGVTGLSPDDDYHRRNKDDYDNILRKTKDLQKHLDSDKFSLDDETEEERRQRLEDLDNLNFLDRQRWNADQEERRRRAMEDRLRENERKREKDEEERRKKEDEERKQQEEEENRKKDEKERRRQEKEEKKRREEEAKKIKEDEEERMREEDKKKQQDEEEKKRKELEKKEKEQAEKQKIEQAEKRKIEETEKRRRDEEDKKKKEAEEGKRKREEQERRQEEEELKKLKKHIPSPDEVIRDTESARQRRRDEKNQLLKDVDDARQARQNQEKIREELVRKAKQMQHKTTNRRNEARDMWKKKYFEEKKKTAPLEENSNRLQNELETLHKRLVNTLEGPKEKHMRFVDPRPSEKNNYVIQSTKLQHEIEDLQRRVENARMKLTAEMKLRNQAQGELRALRAELTQRKQNIELNRQHQLASLNYYQRNGNENNSPSENTVMPPEHPKSYYEGL